MIEGERLARLKRRCSGTCGTVKSWAEFYARRRWPDGTVRDVQARCKECSKSARNKWSADNREHVNREANRRYREGSADPERLALRRARQRDYVRQRDNIPEERWRPERYEGKPAERAGAREGGVDHLTAQWADGRMLYDWLIRQEMIPDSYERAINDQLGGEASLGTTVARVLSRWKNGHIARIDSVDNTLTELGSHISELPDEVWVEKRKQC